MPMSATVAARSALRFAVARSSVASRLSPGLKPGTGTLPKSVCSPFLCSKQNPLAHRIFRAPVELSSCVETMLPYHTATASALLISKLSVPCRSYNWTPDGV